MRTNLPGQRLARGTLRSARIDRQHQVGAANLGRRLAHEIRVLNRSRHDRDLVRAGVQEVPDVLNRPYAAPHAERHEDRFRGASHHVEQNSAALVARRNVEEGDPSPDGNGKLKILRGIEVGHIFQLGQKYSESMQATVLDENGKANFTLMGCYGIGITRVVAAAIEQNNDERGIFWPDSLAPFHLVICPINYHKSETVKKQAEQLYALCIERGIEVLLDDRPLRPGVMFSDMDLIGIPHRIVLSERGIDAKQFEYKGRRDDSVQDIALTELPEFLEKLMHPACAPN